MSMSSIENMAAIEGMFDPEQTAAKLLEGVKENVAKTIKTVEAATALEDKLSKEAAEFNSCLTTMSNAIRKCEQGELTREEMLAECKPCVAALKEKCAALKLADVKTTGDDITENEIAMLREYIVGCKDIVAEHKQSLQAGCDKEEPEAETKEEPEQTPEKEEPKEEPEAKPEEKPAAEGVLSTLSNLEPVTEGQSWQAVKGILGKKARDARGAVKAGKKALKLGHKDEAVKMFTSAKTLFGEQKAELQKLPKDMWDTISSWINVGWLPLIYSFIGEGGYKDAPNKNVNVAAVINYLNRAMDRCDILINRAKAGEAVEDKAVEAMIDFAFAMEAVFDDMDVSNDPEVEVKPATEASISQNIRKSNEAKTANELYKQAKKLYGLGAKGKALDTLKRAQALYEKCLEKTKEYGKMYKVNRKVSGGYVTDKFETEVTDSFSVALTLKYFEDRIDACKALELQWNNKAGNSTFAETKAQLKEERKQTKAEMRAKRKAEKEAAKEQPAEEAAVEEEIVVTENGVASEAYIEACESVLEDTMLDYAEFIATEGQNLEARGIKKHYGKEIKRLANEAKSLSQSGKGAEAKAKYLEAAKLADEMVTEIDKLEPSAGSAVLGYFAYQIKMGLLAGLLAIPTLGIASIVLVIKDLIKQINMVINAINKAAKGELSASDFNMYIDDIKSYAKKMASQYRKAANAVSQAKPEEKAEEALIDGMTVEEFITAMESCADSLESELALETALEAEGAADAETSNATELASRYRAGFAKMKKAKLENNSADAAAAEKEIAAVSDDLKQAANAAKTPEEKKKLSKVAKIAIAGAIAVAAAAGITGAVLLKGKKVVESDNVDPHSSPNLIKRLADMIAVAKAKAMQKQGKPLRLTGETVVDAKASESVLSAMAFGLEGLMCDGEKCEEEKVEPMEGKHFDNEEDIFEDEEISELEEMAQEAAVAVMLAEDGIED